MDGYHSTLNYKIFHSGYELFPFLYIKFSEPIKTSVSAVEMCNICSADGWYDDIDIRVTMKKGEILANPGHLITDGRECGRFQAAAGMMDRCSCKNVTCINPISNVETVAIQRVRLNRKSVFTEGYLDNPSSAWEVKYAKPIRTYLMLNEVTFY